MQLFIDHLHRLYLSTKPPLCPCTPAIKPFFVTVRGFRPTNTSDPYSTYTDGPDSHFNQHLQPIFHHKVTGACIISNNITDDTPLLVDCDIHRPLPLLLNITLNNDTLLLIKNFMTILPCPSLNPPGKLTHPSYLNSTEFIPSIICLTFWHPLESIPNRPQAYHTYIILCRAHYLPTI